MTSVRSLVPTGPLASVASRRVLQSLMRTGQEARFVGGCVRDCLLEIQAADIDIATPLPPEEVMRRLKADGIRVVPTGLKHGTVTAIIGNETFEITTLRQDVETFGRSARVAFTDDWLADAARRDFTFNAMSLTVDGELYDPFGGVPDLTAGRVRFIGDAETRIREDVLRLLRFFRFYARLGKGPPDTAALDACTRLAPLVGGLSGERVREELLKLLATDRAAEVWRIMVDQGIMEHVLPQAVAVDRLAALDRLEWMVGETEPLARLAALLPAGPLAHSAVEAVADRLRFSNFQRDRLAAIAAPVVDVHPDLPFKSRRIALHRLGPEIYRAVLLLSAAAMGTPAFELFEPLAEASAWREIPFPLRGQDILDRGQPPGPEVGRLMGELERWWIAHDFQPDRDACLAELERRLASAASTGEQ
ncbi:CCA tRNA nucleotidyltransferase [Nitrospirillum viridazoti]|uniref:Poly(A) polymerase n=1 Tax=Nitrospirillum viridazoti CBAmc TaxID=1441467 RepID=A0A248JRD6_9PROT|nr:CCA tRNA nucleotidyltransferase [Nitrospirillum amazonense]ASG21169.1 poly(A) polymerase [Nitrospirillum amazonense CBAmc]TWB32159.1 poly(A) polymerase [Nitrospirillum amazonense]